MNTEPENINAERALLGAMMADAEIAKTVAPMLLPEHFYAMQHGLLFSAIVGLLDGGKPTDFLSVSEALQSQKNLEKCGGFSMLSQLVLDSVQTNGSATYYAKIIREKAVLRSLLAASRKIANSAMDGESDVTAAIATAENAVSRAVAGFGISETGGTVADISTAFFRNLMASEASGMRGQTTPWNRLNRVIGGLYPGEMVVWFGRPKDGKSALVAQLGKHIAETDGAVIFFALEMGEQAQIRRWLASAAQLDTRKLRAPELMPSEYERLGKAMESISQLPIWLYGGARSLGEIRRIALQIRSKTKVKAVIIDHIGFLIDLQNGAKNDTENSRLQRAYEGIVRLGQEVDCVTHVVAHSNRDGYDREPTLKNIRGGGNPEGLAHSVIAIHRPDPEENPTHGKFIVIANREGVSGALDMHFGGARFEWRDVMRVA